jgi:hypothetical protein
VLRSIPFDDIDVNKEYSQDVWNWGRTIEALLKEACVDHQIEPRSCLPNPAVFGIDEG